MLNYLYLNSNQKDTVKLLLLFTNLINKIRTDFKNMILSWMFHEEVNRILSEKTIDILSIAKPRPDYNTNILTV